jgi:hypothetical protein
VLHINNGEGLGGHEILLYNNLWGGGGICVNLWDVSVNLWGCVCVNLWGCDLCKFVGVCLCKFSMENRAGYSHVISWFNFFAI